MIAGPRWPTLGSTLFSMIRTGMPFFNKVRASISPEGPAPTYIKRLDRRMLTIDKINSVQLELGQSLMLNGRQLDGPGHSAIDKNMQRGK